MRTLASLGTPLLADQLLWLPSSRLTARDAYLTDISRNGLRAMWQRSVATLPWRHNIALPEKLKSSEEREGYTQQAIENGWSRDMLVFHIENHLHRRMGGAITNFDQVLPKPLSDLAHSLLKNPYRLDLLSLSQDAQERDLEQALVTHIQDFLL